MDARTLKALRESIRKWEKIWKGTGEDKRSGNCHLCKEFLYKTPGCEGCPVNDKGYQTCYGSPWTTWIEHLWKYHEDEKDKFGLRVYCPTCKRLARRELDFLKALLPKRRGEIG